MATREMEVSAPLSVPIGLSGDLTNAQIVEAGAGAGAAAPGNIIRSDQSWDLNVEWYIQGALLGMGPILPWEWVIYVGLESMGQRGDYNLPNPPYIFPMMNRTVDPLDDTKWLFSVSIPMPAGTPPQNNYKAVVVLNCRDTSTMTPRPISGFLELPGMVQFYQV